MERTHDVRHRFKRTQKKVFEIGSWNGLKLEKEGFWLNNFNESHLKLHLGQNIQITAIYVSNMKQIVSFRWMIGFSELNSGINMTLEECNYFIQRIHFQYFHSIPLIFFCIFFAFLSKPMTNELFCSVN